MKFDRIVSLERQDNEEGTQPESNVSLRPTCLKDYIGQETLKAQMEIFIQSAKKRQKVLDHVLLYGPPGLGKTTLASIIANEMSGNIKLCVGPMITRPADLASVITQLSQGDFLFIDEIHRLNRSVEEVLYACMEDFRLDILVGEGASARSLSIDLPPFTLIGATTRAGLLSAPFRDRFGVVQNFGFYAPDALSKILMRSAKLLNIAIDPQSANEIASRSRGTPRIANRLLRRVLDYTIAAELDCINIEIASHALISLKVDQNGLDEIDRKLLEILVVRFSGGPVGINSLATAMGEERDVIEDVIEPYLIQSGYLHRTSRGRIAAEKAYALFQKDSET